MDMEIIAGDEQDVDAHATVMIFGFSSPRLQLTITAGTGYSILPGFQNCLPILLLLSSLYFYRFFINTVYFWYFPAYENRCRTPHMNPAPAVSIGRESTNFRPSVPYKTPLQYRWLPNVGMLYLHAVCLPITHSYPPHIQIYYPFHNLFFSLFQ